MRLRHLGTHADMESIIGYLTREGRMTAQRLGYLCYWAYAWGLLVLEREICPFTFIQTCYGPHEIEHDKLYPATDYHIDLDPDLQLLLDIVLDTYGQEDIRELESRLMEHLRDIPLGRTITARDIYCFFARVRDK